jgi:hypothetical protein
MCTVTIIPLPAGGFRLVTNRDEQRSRAAALPPRVMPIGDVGERGVWPIDGEAGGTWIGASACGTVLTLLNVNDEAARAATPPRESLRSRGGIVLEVLRGIIGGGRNAALPVGARLDAMARRAERLELDRYAPFRLVGACDDGVVEFRWDRARLEARRLSLAPACFVSSGLGDHRVEPRLGLWGEWIARHGATPAAQDEFHRHRWPERAEISVLMSRADARTVSTTAVEIGPGKPAGEARSVVMRYRDDGGDRVVSLDGGPIGVSSAVHERARC